APRKRGDGSGAHGRIVQRRNSGGGPRRADKSSIISACYPDPVALDAAAPRRVTRHLVRARVTVGNFRGARMNARKIALPVVVFTLALSMTAFAKDKKKDGGDDKAAADTTKTEGGIK